MNGHDVRLGGRRIVTLLGDRQHYPTLVRSLDTATPRRRAVRAVLWITTTTRATPMVSRSVNAADAEMASLLTLVRDSVGDDLRAAMVVWPAGDRLHRRYVIAADGAGALVAFAKASTRPEVDAASFRAERDVLVELERSPLTRIRTPRVLGAVDTPQLTALVLEAIPAVREHLTWDEVIGLLPLAQVGAAGDLARAGLTHAVAGLNASPSFADAVAAGLPLLQTTTANGDMRPSNVVRAEGQIWLFDWEFGSDRAPATTDLVSALLTRRVESDPVPEPERVLHELLGALRARGVTESEAALGVLYLASTGQPWATALVQGWWPAPHTSEEGTLAP